MTARTTRSWLRIVAATASAALITAACASTDDMEADTEDPVEETEDEDAGDTDDTDDADDTDDGAEDGEDGGDAAADGKLGELQAAGTATIGIANEVPYAFEDEDGNVTGQAPEIAYEVFERLGIDNVEAEVVDFGALIPGLQAGQFDTIAAGMFITPERAEQVIFADPDYCVTYSIAVPAGNPQDISGFDSVVESGATLAVLSGAVDEDYAADAGVPADQVELFNDVNDQYEALAAGRVDAVGGTSLTVVEQTEASDEIEATEFFFPVDAEGNEIPGCGAFGFDDQEFRDAFNEVLDELKEDGTALEITTSFGFAEEDVLRAFDFTVEDLAS